MPAFSDRIHIHLTEEVRKLAKRALYYNHLSLTKHQVIDLCAPIEHREILKQAALISRAGGHSDSVMVSLIPPPMELNVVFHVDDRVGPPVLLPKKPKMQDDQPELVKIVTNWATRRREIRVGFGLVDGLIGFLKKNCSSPGQVRYAWPPILGLCQGKDLEAFASKIAEFKAPRTHPNTSPGLRDAIRACSTMVTTALLLPDATPDRKEETRTNLGYLGPFTDQGSGIYVNPVNE